MTGAFAIACGLVLVAFGSQGGCQTRCFNAFDCGDGIHPSVLGYYEMGKAVDLTLFTAPR